MYNETIGMFKHLFYNITEVGIYVLVGGYTYSSSGLFVSSILFISITGISSW